MLAVFAFLRLHVRGRTALVAASLVAFSPLWGDGPEDLQDSAVLLTVATASASTRLEDWSVLWVPSTGVRTGPRHRRPVSLIRCAVDLGPERARATPSGCRVTRSSRAGVEGRMTWPLESPPRSPVRPRIAERSLSTYLGPDDLTRLGRAYAIAHLRFRTASCRNRKAARRRLVSATFIDELLASTSVGSQDGGRRTVCRCHQSPAATSRSFGVLARGREGARWCSRPSASRRYGLRPLFHRGTSRLPRGESTIR